MIIRSMKITSTVFSCLCFILIQLSGFKKDNPISVAKPGDISWVGGLPQSNAVSSLAVNGSNLFAGTYYGGVYLSTNAGNSWTAVNSGIAATYIVNNVIRVESLKASEGTLFSGT